MPFQMRDETSGVNILYIDNSGNMGLGTLPVAGQKITVYGVGVISTSGTFGAGTLVPGVQAAYEGTLSVPASSTGTVSVATAQLPTVTSTLPSSSASTSQVVFDNTANSSATNVNYSIW